MTRAQPKLKCDFIGCGKREGWKRLEAMSAPEGMMRVFYFDIIPLWL
jgi:hypothetical protein